MISPDDIVAAARRISPHVRRTPLIALEAEAFGLPAAVMLKLELLQHSGSFKARGAFNNLLARPVPASGVIAASGGNHGAAVAFAARSLGHRAEIFVPKLASAAKVARLKDYGAAVTVTGESYAEAFAASEARRAETGALSVHAYDSDLTLAGQGTLARELDAQSPSIDTLLVAVGGGGLIGGIAAWYRGKVRVVGVEPKSCPTLERAFAAKHPVEVAVGGLAADSLGAKRVGDLMFEIAKDHVEGVVLVEDDAIRQAQRRLWNDLRIMAEPGGATALAALTSGAYQPAVGEKIGVIVCGGNVDPSSVG
jgi:threonine dehydratase